MSKSVRLRTYRTCLSPALTVTSVLCELVDAVDAAENVTRHRVEVSAPLIGDLSIAPDTWACSGEVVLPVSAVHWDGHLFLLSLPQPGESEDSPGSVQLATPDRSRLPLRTHSLSSRREVPTCFTSYGLTFGSVG